MSKKVIKIGVRVVERPRVVSRPPGEPYRPPKKPVFKAIATCEINGKRLSKTASMPTEEESKQAAFSKLATLVAKQGAMPIQGFGFEKRQAN